MTFIGRRSTLNVSLVVVLIVFIVFMMQNLNRFKKHEFTFNAIKNKLITTPTSMPDLAKNLQAPANNLPALAKNLPVPSSPGKVGPTNSVLETLRRNGMVILPDKEAMKNMSAEALFQTYHSYLDNNDILCKRKLRMGLSGGGGWEVCDDKPYRPSDKCLVYSFGINNDFSFDDDIAKVYSCSVISFDPSMRQASYQRSPRVYFLQMGIGGNNSIYKGWQLRTLGFYLNKFNHSNSIIDVLKIDVEWSEWPSLPEMVKSGHLHKVKQLLLEYHGKSTVKSKLISELSILKDIYDLGFRKFYVHKNDVCSFKTSRFPVARTQCYEVHYVNVNFL